MTLSSRGYFELLYERYNDPQYIHPDPLELVRAYDKPADREVAGLVCSALALGRVAGILSACRTVLSVVPSPRADVLQASTVSLRRKLRGFVYRFFREDDIVEFLLAIGEVLRRYGSLEECFLLGDTTDDALPGLEVLVSELRSTGRRFPDILVPVPNRGSACKRHHLFLRWMVRRDAVDPGGWTRVTPAGLRVPVDTHMLQVARHLGITDRKQADERTSWAITQFFRTISPSDPVRYDFVLTRAGISGRETIRQDVYGADLHVRPA